VTRVSKQKTVYRNTTRTATGQLHSTCVSCHMPLLAETRAAERAEISFEQDGDAPKRQIHDHSFVGADDARVPQRLHAERSAIGQLSTAAAGCHAHQARGGRPRAGRPPQRAVTGGRARCGREGNPTAGVVPKGVRVRLMFRSSPPYFLRALGVPALSESLEVTERRACQRRFSSRAGRLPRPQQDGRPARRPGAPNARALAERTLRPTRHR
jgi:hypothetical protein